ncbi:MAG: sodium:proton antiporter [Tepidiformaceae bacterium]
MSDVADLQQLLPELLLLAAVVVIITRRFHLPDTSALALAGVLFGSFANIHPEISRDLILLAFLPPLLFEGALNIEFGEFVRRWKQIALLAVPGTLVAAGTIALGLNVLAGFSWPHAALVGIMLAPTDPVSVLATMKEHGVSGGLRALLEGESIFNDAAAIVLFSLALTWAFPENHHREGFLATSTELVGEVGIGVVVGLVIGFAVHRLMATVSDHLIEITLSIVCSYGAYVAADRLGGSGVMAVVFSGLLLSNYGVQMSMSTASRQRLADFWEVIAFLVNSAAFVLIGLAFEISSLRDAGLVKAVVIIAVAVLVGRVIVVSGMLVPFARWVENKPLPGPWGPAIFWGGLRGTIPIALVLGLALNERELGGIQAVPLVFSVVLLSLLGQGLTYGPLLRKLGLSATEPPDPSRAEG